MPNDHERQQEIARLLRESERLRQQSDELARRAERLRHENEELRHGRPSEAAPPGEVPISGAEPTVLVVGNEPTVLIVDDEPAVRAIVSRQLTEAGYNVLSAAGGAEALRLLNERGPIHLLLTDLRMPIMSGVDLGVQVQRLCPGARVIVMAAYPSDDEIVWPVLLKPFPPGLLEAEIRRALDGPATP